MFGIVVEREYPEMHVKHMVGILFGQEAQGLVQRGVPRRGAYRIPVSVITKNIAPSCMNVESISSVIEVWLWYLTGTVDRGGFT